MNQFKQFHFKPAIMNTLDTLRIVEPTPIQVLTIPPILAGNDILAEAQTGTGKTLAFLLPMFQQFTSGSDHIQGLILTPTRELALQITEVAKHLAVATDTSILAVYGGQDLQTQLKRLKRSVNLVIATPGRLIDHIARGTVDLSHLQVCVLDEADQMLLVGFKDEVEHILKKTNKDKQLLCFSATLDSKVKKLGYRFMTSPLEFTAKKATITLETITQSVIKSSDRNKQAALVETLRQTNPFLGIIFCRTKRRADQLEGDLLQLGFSLAKLHGDMSQAARQTTMKGFRNAKFQFLITTDVAARGIDVNSITHIYNYDIPETPETYIHRIGRTGRMGETGIAFTFAAPKDQAILSAIEKTIGKKLPFTTFGAVFEEENRKGQDRQQREPKNQDSKPSHKSSRKKRW